MEVCASPQKPRYRLLYLPIPEDVGTHQLTVRLDGSSEPLVSITLFLRAKTAEISESVIRMK